MEKTQYLALVHREANLLLDEHGDAFRASSVDPEHAAAIDDAVDRQLAEILPEIDYLEDVLKWSELRDVDPRLWRSGDSWQGVLVGAALAALAYDVRTCAGHIVEGKLPRMRNVQVGSMNENEESESCSSQH